MTTSSISAFAPGRVELLGNHTDYNQGVVLAGAIDRGLKVTGSHRPDQIASFRSPAIGNPVDVDIEDFAPQEKERWANYGLGVVKELLQAGHELGGFSAEVSGDLSPGSGLSSSAAFEVATAYFLAKLFKLDLPPEAVARLCRRAENEFVGVPSGLLDQTTSVFGRADHVVYLDCRNEEVQTIPFLPDVALIIAESGSKHSLVAGEYKARREECLAAARALNVASLRDINPQQLAERGGSLDPILRKRASHIVGENDRVWRALKCFENGDAVGMGALMNVSHESSRVDFENSTPELDALVSLAQSLPGVFGSRLGGGGFGGSTVTLVAAKDASAAADSLNREWRSRSGHAANAFVCRLADGAAALFNTSRDSAN